MLGNYLSFNGERFPNPLPASTSRTDPVETTIQSEGGTDLTVMAREAKSVWTMSFELSRAKRDRLKALCQEEKTTMTYMNDVYIVRVRGYSEKVVDGSEWLNTVDGLFECSVTVTEY